jgi:hypothetical protein
MRKHIANMHPKPEDIGKWECEEKGCDFSCNTKERLAKHHNNNHITVHCKYTGCSFKGPKHRMFRHYAKHLKRYMCQDCGLILSSDEALNKHEGRFHKNDFPDKNDPGLLTKCDDCLEEFLNDQCKRAHKCPRKDTACNQAAINKRFNQKKLAAMSRPIGDYKECHKTPTKRSRLDPNGPDMVLLYSDSPPVDQRLGSLEASVVSVHYNSYNVLDLRFDCTNLGITGKLTLGQLLFFKCFNLVHGRTVQRDPKFLKTKQPNMKIKREFSRNFTETTHLGHFKEHSVGGSGLSSNMFLQGELSNLGMKSWLEALTRHYLRSKKVVYVTDGTMYERELPLYTLNVPTHEEAKARFTQGNTEAAAALLRITLVIDPHKNETTLQSWLYTNYGCDVPK